MTQKYLSKQIKSLRKKHNLTQQQLADLLSVSNKTVSKWENDEGTPDLDNLKRMAQVFNVSIDSLVNLAPVTPTKTLLDNTNRIYLIFTILGLAASFLTILQVNPLGFASNAFDSESLEYWSFIEPFSNFNVEFIWLNLKFYHVFIYLFRKFNIFLLTYIMTHIAWFITNIIIIKKVLTDSFNKHFIYVLLALDLLIILSLVLLSFTTNHFRFGLASIIFTGCHIIMLYMVYPSTKKLLLKK